jgi:outer membrane protein assembly factor BamB
MLLICVAGMTSCAKHDPILPGVRHDIFESNDVKVLDKEVPELSSSARDIYGDADCKYTQDSLNNIWLGERKIYSGFAMDSVVKSGQSPICSGRYIYTGLSSGEVIKLNTANNKTVWATDVYRLNNLTGGASVVDIVAHVGLVGNYIYAGGLGDAFCKINANTGTIVWCVGISVPVDFIIVDDFAFVVGTDNKLYAVNIDNGTVYWQTGIKKQSVPKYDGQNIIVEKLKINYKNGRVI